MGWPVSHSLSPSMHNAAAAKAGLNLAYVPLPVHPARVKSAVHGLAALGFRGVNVTVPHKQAVMPFLDKLEAGAKAIGAVNTIKVDEPDGESPRLTGFNTDWTGFLADLTANNVTIRGRDCLLLGAGGSARAVAYALGQMGCAVHVLARRPNQAEGLVHQIKPFVKSGTLYAHDLAALGDLMPSVAAPLIVNTTPLGMTPNIVSSPWPTSLPFPKDSFIYDLVYNPPQTALMAQAQRANCPTINGLGMLIWQGAKAFEIWTAVAPDVAVMRRAVLEL